MSDPRLMVETPHPDGRPRAAGLEWDSHRQRYTVRALGTNVLGYVKRVGLNHLGQRPTPHAASYADVGTGIPTESSVARYVYQATDRNGFPLDEPVDSEIDAAALVVGAAHSADPLPEHVVPRNVGGRPLVGKPINVRLGDDLLAKVDADAKASGRSRADMLREIVARAYA